MYKHYKRSIDVLFSLVGSIFLLPVFLVVSIIIKLESRGPVLFKQERWGRNRTTFTCYKFRTMTVNAPSNVATRQLKNSNKYITRGGKLIRRLGIDELPQLLNVIKGDMSLIGPRPVVLAEVALIDERDKYGANALLPGIGGWAQSNGRDEIDCEEKARLDGEYAQNFGLRMDISCLWRTAVAVFSSKGFKEGHFGDDAYRRRVRRNTKKISFARRIYGKVANGAAKRKALRKIG